MRFFRRDQDTTDGDFWAWWASAREPIATGITSGGIDDRLVRQISDAVHRVHPNLAWELGPGRIAEHVFCVSPEGDAVLRIVALRWLEGAPAPDATWEYAASRQPSGPERLQVLQLGSIDVPLDDMRAIAGWDESRQVLDVKLWHPAFPSLPEQGRLQAAFLFLDNLLGEDDVERWIGEIEVLEAPTGGRTPAELAAEVDRHRGDPVDDNWVLATGESRDGPVFVLANAGLKRIDHPFAEHHVAIRIPLDGLPDDAAAERLNAEEEDLLGRLTGAAIQAGRRTDVHGRTIHLVTADPDRARAICQEWAAQLPERRIRIEVKRDPRWTFREELGQ